MRLRGTPLSGKLNIWLHLLLAAGVLAYVYSPLLDHVMDKGVYSRPHTHLHFAGELSQRPSHFREDHPATDHDEHDDADESVICLLNIDALLSLLLSIFILPDTPAAPQEPLVGNLDANCLDVSLVYLSSLDPPPNI